MNTNHNNNNRNAPKKAYSPEQIMAYELELGDLLERAERATTHYEVLGLDALATTGEVKLAYMRASALLNPSYYSLELPQPKELLPKIDNAFAKVSQAFAVLVNFNRRAEYDDSLFQRAESQPESSIKENEVAGEIKASERRRHQRFELSLPVRVSGYDRKGGKWHEMTQSVDASMTGTALTLSMPVRKGMILSLSMPMPMTLRSHGFFDDTYEVYAIVRRVKRKDEKVSLIGVEFLGEQPPEAYFEKPWGVFQSETLEGEERRKAPRKKQSKPVNIEYLDGKNQLISREDAVAEDISKVGMRVCVKHAPIEYFIVKVFADKGKFETLAFVTERFRGEDGLERLCLQFVGE